METLTWWQFYWQALLKALEFPNNILGIIGIVFLLIKLFPPKYEHIWRDSKLSTGYIWIKKYSLRIFLILVSSAIVYAPYGLYKEKQEEMNDVLADKLSQINELQHEITLIQEEHRPRLTLDPTVTLNPGVDEINQEANITIKTKVNNIGDRPAYQSLALVYCSPLYEPQKLQKYEGVYDTNPIYKETETNVITSYVGSFSKINNNTGAIFIYMRIKWSDAPLGKDGKWDDETYRFTLKINLDANTITLHPAQPEVIKIFDPYITE